MNQISIKFPEPRFATYSIWIGAGIMGEIVGFVDLSRYSKILVVTDENVASLHLEKVLSILPGDTGSIILPSGERSKHIESVQKIWTALQDGGCDRKSLVINLGGGVVCDVGGFAASTYMRGIDFLNIPTTLLSQVDASVGGKTGIDFSGIKNLVGTFNQPIGVIIDVATLKTLPKREFVSGFAEIVKHGLIQSRDYFEKVTSKKPYEYSAQDLIEIITESCGVKANIVEQDPSEQGARKILNFGHTLGHAFESLSFKTKNPLLHGEAISIGMLAEAHISRDFGILSQDDLALIEEKLAFMELPISVENINLDAVLEKIKSDKKNECGKINFTLLQGIGHAIYNQRVDEKSIVKAIQSVIEKSL